MLEMVLIQDVSVNYLKRHLRLKRGRTLQFLMKLDPKFKRTRSSLIMMKDISTLSEVDGILIQKQVHMDIGKNDEEHLQESIIAHRVEKRKYNES